MPTEFRIVSWKPLRKAGSSGRHIYDFLDTLLSDENAGDALACISDDDFFRIFLVISDDTQVDHWRNRIVDILRDFGVADDTYISMGARSRSSEAEATIVTVYPNGKPDLGRQISW